MQHIHYIHIYVCVAEFKTYMYMVEYVSEMQALLQAILPW